MSAWTRLRETRLSMRDTLLIVAHGSQDPDHIAEFWALIGKVRAGASCPVEGAFLDYLEPSIPAGVRACIEKNATRVRVFPCFLFEGRHVLQDIPGILREVGLKYPGIFIETLPCLGRNPALGRLFASRISEAARRLPDLPADRAVIFVAGGSKNQDANAALLREALRYRASRENKIHVDHAFLDLATPALEETLVHSLDGGRPHVILQPYFLFTGTLVKRIRAAADAVKKKRPELKAAIGRPLGPDDRIARMILEEVSKSESVGA